MIPIQRICPIKNPPQRAGCNSLDERVIRTSCPPPQPWAPLRQLSRLPSASTPRCHRSSPMFRCLNGHIWECRTGIFGPRKTIEHAVLYCVLIDEDADFLCVKALSRITNLHLHRSEHNTTPRVRLFYKVRRRMPQKLLN